MRDRPASDAALVSMPARRPWLPPSRPWIMRQTWYDLLFAHWPVPAQALRVQLPAGLELDRFDGEAWLGVVPFGIRGARPRYLPFSLPWLSAFPELNLRTYVVAEGKPGVWFFSLDAANPLAVAAARRWYHLPYYNARMRLRHAADWIDYASERTHRGAPSATFVARYRPVGDRFHTRPGSLESWLTDRYCLYAADRRGRLYRADIQHRPWTLHAAEAEFTTNTLAEPLGLRLAGTPMLHFAPRLDMVAWLLERVGG